MRAMLAVFFVGLLLTAFSTAQQVSLRDLQQRADLAKGSDCVHLSMQAARQTLEEANRLFTAGDSKAAHTEIDHSLHFVRRSVDCSLQAHKSEKSEEIDLRKLIHRMKDIMQTLDSDDHDHISKSLAELEAQRDRMLSSLFGTGASRSGEKKP